MSGTRVVMTSTCPPAGHAESDGIVVVVEVVTGVVVDVVVVGAALLVVVELEVVVGGAEVEVVDVLLVGVVVVGAALLVVVVLEVVVGGAVVEVVVVLGAVEVVVVVVEQGVVVVAAVVVVVARVVVVVVVGPTLVVVVVVVLVVVVEPGRLVVVVVVGRVTVVVVVVGAGHTKICPSMASSCVRSASRKADCAPASRQVGQPPIAISFAAAASYLPVAVLRHVASSNALPLNAAYAASVLHLPIAPQSFARSLPTPSEHLSPSADDGTDPASSPLGSIGVPEDVSQ